MSKSGLHYFDLKIADGFDAYLVRETKTTYEVISPITYFWMQRRGLKGWENVVETTHVDKQLVTLRPFRNTREYADWIFDYPIETTSLHHFKDIASFFETFCSFRNTSPSERLEKTLATFEKRMPRTYLESFATFVFHQHMTHPDRLRFLFSIPISHYVKRCRDDEDSI